MQRNGMHEKNGFARRIVTHIDVRPFGWSAEKRGVHRPQEWLDVFNEVEGCKGGSNVEG